MLKTLDFFDLKNKAILLRVDINSPIINGNVVMNDRIKEHAKTIKELLRKKAKVTILAHQGRKGEEDYMESLEQHAKLLSRVVGKKIIYVNDIYGAVERIKSLKPGEALLLKNVRSLDEETLKLTPEEHAKSKLVTTLAPLFDYFVQDAFSVCHRSQASVVGFAKVLPTIIGRVLEKELISLNKIEKLKEGTFILGGAKIEECIILLKYIEKNKIDAKVLSSGVFSLACASAKGYDVGNENIVDENLVSEIKEFMKNVSISIPKDFAIEDENGKRKEVKIEELPTNKKILDIGKETIKEYKDIIKKSKFIFLKGPAGKYEDKKFRLGTKEILSAVANSKAYSIIGGGNTLDAINLLKIPKSKFSHISLGGGALLEYIAGEKLPGLEVIGFYKK
ncbi:MAG: phosphoglycerate kinase [Candidatus Aenigmarchaeota archaeon]|nr:phosphoglycerate kinase [Candidatus Aenigmarchaeota archaeon]